MKKVLLYILVLLVIPSKFSGNEKGIEKEIKTLNYNLKPKYNLKPNNNLSGISALRMFESLSLTLESSKSYRTFVNASEMLHHLGSLINLDDSETYNLICKRLLEESGKQLVLYDFFIKEVLPNSSCKTELISKQTGYLRQFKHPALDIDLDGNIKFNSKNINKKIKNIKIINDQKIFYGHEFPKNHIALTFDDGPHNHYTEFVINMLEAYDAKGSFFMMGKKVKKLPDVAKKVAEAGNNVGSHSFDHPDLSKISTDLAFENIINGHNIIKDILSDIPESFHNIFRFPYGATTPELQKKVSDAGFSTFFWNIDPRDWDNFNPIEIKDSIIKIIKRRNTGSILLLHDHLIQTAFALPLILEELSELEDITLLILNNQASPIVQF